MTDSTATNNGTVFRTFFSYVWAKIVLDISYNMMYSWCRYQDISNAMIRTSRRWGSQAASREGASRRMDVTSNPPESVSEQADR